jgi:hypothetical protein
MKIEEIIDKFNQANTKKINNGEYFEYKHIRFDKEKKIFSIVIGSGYYGLKDHEEDIKTYLIKENLFKEIIERLPDEREIEIKCTSLEMIERYKDRTRETFEYDLHKEIKIGHLEGKITLKENLIIDSLKIEFKPNFGQWVQTENIIDQHYKEKSALLWSIFQN